jgi:hypothetical protein
LKRTFPQIQSSSFLFVNLISLFSIDYTKPLLFLVRFLFSVVDFHFSQVIRQPYFVDRLIVKLKEKENTLQCVYLNEFNMAIGAFIIQSNEAKNWYDGINKARHIYIKLKQDSQETHQISRHHSINNNTTSDSLSIRKSPLGSSIGLFYSYI